MVDLIGDGSLSATRLGEAIGRGELKVTDALEACFAKIEEKEKDLGCFITLNKEGAFLQAEKVQHMIDAGRAPSPLAGVPVAVKDNICTKGIRTTCGSKMLADYIPPYDAFVVEQLKNAGCILIGKTNMDEFAMGSATETSFFGSCKNPLDPEYTPGGSSGGSAAAVAAGEAFAAIGSDTGGSVRQPAACCGLYGLKPTYGSVSRRGLIAYASSMDQIGPITRDPEDCAALFSLLSMRDPEDATCHGQMRPSYKQLLSVMGRVKGMRIAILRDPSDGKAAKNALENLSKARQLLSDLGAETEEIKLPEPENAVSAYYTIALAQAASNLARYDGVAYGHRTKEPCSGLKEMIRKSRTEGFGEEVKRRIMLGNFVLSAEHYDAYYRKALQVREGLVKRYEQLFSRYDVILSLTMPALPPKLSESLRDPVSLYRDDSYTCIANLLGLCSMAVPFGSLTEKLPGSLLLTANRFAEEKLFAAAGALAGHTGE
ncbi:MAG: Asp-tRNA(Asn)/Glu-tRNA(Gln) amidotransferase subunit GatA [Lachnospiraceae bacterium]|nr:Asp-tRNA(Asn)/Glu-tRNA(Gln) amidotransferase subunit GatA [Lachnospiraceae bacterium]